ncbi:DUF2155 domain-containing protein [Shimia litoralis]|nr:DUF2155 domain-containing protein [Shimia litoralis]
MKHLVLSMMVLCGAASAQQTIVVETLDGGPGQIVTMPDEPSRFSVDKDLGNVTSEVATPAVKAGGAMLRGLDKLNGIVVDFDLDNGYSRTFGDLRVDLGECRHPEDNATGEGYAYLTIYDGLDAEGPVFQGWMVASSPALNALDHARYDVWVLRCKTS